MYTYKYSKKTKAKNKIYYPGVRYTKVNVSLRLFTWKRISCLYLYIIIITTLDIIFAF